MAYTLVFEPFERKFISYGLFTTPTIVCICVYFIGIIFPLILAAATNGFQIYLFLYND
jgi:hypothetical protein